ncbi:MAG: hypothetical protein KDD43_02050 [Bdellovibrionales bacterium]|nr:hypothetical protein [Bdellovibrionales bacterium]
MTSPQLKTFANDWGQRPYRLWLPQEHPPRFLVTGLHGCFMDSQRMALDTRLAELVVNQLGGALLCPQQDRQANEWMGWNWFLPENQKTNGAGETVLLRQLITDTLFQLKISRDRSGLIGISAGSAMATNLAFNCPQLFKCGVFIAGPAFASAQSAEEGLQVMQSGPTSEPTSPPFQLPRALLFHGEKDSVVNTRHLDALQKQWEQSIDPVAAKVVQVETAFSWETQLTTSTNANVFTSHLVKNMAHAWPGGRQGCDFMSPEHEQGMGIILGFFSDSLLPQV